MSDQDNDYEGVEEEFPGVTKAANAALQPAHSATQTVVDIDGPANVLDLDSVTAYTQKLRLGAVKTIKAALREGVDSEMINALLKTASDMDKAVVNRRRVGIEEEAAKTSEQTQRDSAAILRAISAKTFQIDPNDMDPNRQAPRLDDSIPPPELVPDETTIGAQQLNYDSFAKELPQS